MFYETNTSNLTKDPLGYTLCYRFQKTMRQVSESIYQMMKNTLKKLLHLITKPDITKKLSFKCAA